MHLVLHVGQHKTGSKALQSALYANRDFLADQGIAYPMVDAPDVPRPWQMNHHALFEALRRQIGASDSPGAHDSTRAMRESDGPVQAWLGRMLEQCPAHARVIVLSAEDLFDMHTAHEADFALERAEAGAAALARALQSLGITTTLYVYLRRQDHLLGAHYAQFIKGMDCHHESLQEFMGHFEERLDSDMLLECWERAFGRQAVRVVPYERTAMPEGIVADFFSRALGMGPPPMTVPFPDDLDAFNITPSRDHLEFMRCLNRRTVSGKEALTKSVVLESAFRDPAPGPTGIGAWLSPAARAQLLARHASGNERIATRHGLGNMLFREPAPDAISDWQSPPAPGLHRLIALDSQARAIAGAHSKARRSLWMTTPQSQPEDEALAVAVLEGALGDPAVAPQLLPSPDLADLLSTAWRTRLLVLVGPVRHAARVARAVKTLRGKRVTIVQCLGRLPADRDSIRHLERAAPLLDVLVCRTPALLKELQERVPALAAVPTHLMGSLPDMRFELEQWAVA